MKTMTAKVIKSSGGSGLAVSRQVEPDTFSTFYGSDGLIQPPYPMAELQRIMEISTILKQCVEAYRRNITGFGALPKYKVEEKETDEMEREWDALAEWVQFFNFDKSFEDVWGTAIEHREITGNGYIEILRDGLGRAAGGENMPPETIRVTKLSDPVAVEYKRGGKVYKRYKRFRGYCQVINGQKIWYKEFGDPRQIDSRTGKFYTVDQATPASFQAGNEILHMKIGDGAYGVPRWIAHLIHMYGARKAEELNYRYFVKGRHTPMAILLSNARLSEESEAALTEYAQSVEGVENSHAFLLIEADGAEATPHGTEDLKPKVELKSLADMLQQDALFLEYDEASRQKVQSAFRLPDIYVGRSKDFNRATADTARSITEEQVFEPERNSLEWVINNVLLPDFEFKLTQIHFAKPDIGDTKDKVALLNVINNVGGLTPNDVRDLAGWVLGKALEPLVGDEYNRPYSKGQAMPKELAGAAQGGQADVIALAKDAGIVAILKDVRDALQEMRAA